MKKQILLLSFLILNTFYSTSQTWEWVRKISGTANDTGFSIDIDNEGNVFIAGRCRGATTFEDETDPIGPLLIGDRDIYVSKYTNDGQLIWATLAGGVAVGYDLAQCVRVDNEGGCYLTGFFNNESYFGDDTLTSVGNRDAFVTRLNADGDFLWAKGFGGTGEDNGYGAAVDSEGNILICGRVNGIVDVEGTSIGTAGQFNAYIGKYDSDGNFIEIHDFKSSFRSSARKIVLDADDNIYVCGGLNGSCIYEGMSLVTDHGPAWDDAFVLKCNADFSPVWFQSGGGNYYDMGLNLAVSENTVYMCGTYGGVALFDTIPITFNSDATGTAGTNAAKDLFIASYDKSSGGIKWLIGAGNEGIDEAHGIQVTSDEMIYFSGYYRDSVSFDDTTLYAGGLNTTNILTGKLDSLGNVIWIRETGNSTNNRGLELAIDPYENIYCAGDFYSTVSFDGIPHTASNRDAFGGKLTQHPDPSYTIDTHFCVGDTITISLNGITSPLTYTYSALDAYTSWMDSTHIYYLVDTPVSMNLTGYIYASNNIYTDSILIDTVISTLANPIITLVDEISSCLTSVEISVEEGYSSYNWEDGLSLTNELTTSISGLYHLTVENMDGCITKDSVLVMLVGEGYIIDLPTDTADCDELTYTVVDEYYSYSWNGGIDLDNEITIESSGMYYLVVTDSMGCWAIDSMEVTIFTSPTPSIGGDTLICEGADFEITTDDFYENYEWSTGETGVDHITVTSSNTYEVTVQDENGCTGSNSIDVTFTDCAGIDEFENNLSLAYLTYSKTLKNTASRSIENIVITTIEGKIVFEINRLNAGESIQLIDLAPAVYLIYSPLHQNLTPFKILIAE